jgi:tetratricopeptide (TPR) repeat protein
VLNSIGVAYYYEGQLVRAERFFQRALQLMAAENVTSHMTEILNNLGAIYTSQRRYEQARQSLERALEVRRSEVGDAHPDLALTLNLLGNLYTQTARYAEAEATYVQAIQLLHPYGAQFETRRARVLYALSRAYEAEGRHGDHERELADAVAIALRQLSTPSMAEIVNAYASELERHGEPYKVRELQDNIKRVQAGESLVVTAKGLL